MGRAEKALAKHGRHLAWRDEPAAGLSLINLHCLELCVYRADGHWFIECKGLSINHMALPQEIDLLTEAKHEALARAASKLRRIAELADALAKPAPRAKETP